MGLPNLSPLIAADAYCSTCGTKMKTAVEKDKQGRAQKIIYTCKNPETGCSYYVESDQRMNGMAHLLSAPLKTEGK